MSISSQLVNLAGLRLLPGLDPEAVDALPLGAGGACWLCSLSEPLRESIFSALAEGIVEELSRGRGGSRADPRPGLRRIRAVAALLRGERSARCVYTLADERFESLLDTIEQGLRAERRQPAARGCDRGRAKEEA